MSLSQLAVSPDGKTTLFTRMVSEGADLMPIENFRFQALESAAGKTLFFIQRDDTLP